MPPAAAVKQGASVEVPLTLARLYGFADVVTLKTKVPAEAKGLKVADVTVPADQAQAKLKVDATAETPPGKYVLNVTAVAKYNGQDLSVTRDVPVTVEVPEAAK